MPRRMHRREITKTEHKLVRDYQLADIPRIMDVDLDDLEVKLPPSFDPPETIPGRRPARRNSGGATGHAKTSNAPGP